MRTLKQLLNTIPQEGTLEWIGIRPQRRAAMVEVYTAKMTCETGLEGDRYSGRTKNRQITIIQAEHLPVIASCVGLEAIKPTDLRRNLMVSGVNLLAFKDKFITIGQVQLEVTGLCHPCSRMEEIFGPGGYNAVRGHGGLTARVLSEGAVSVGDRVLLNAKEGVEGDDMPKP